MFATLKKKNLDDISIIPCSNTEGEQASHYPDINLCRYKAFSVALVLADKLFQCFLLSITWRAKPRGKKFIFWKPEKKWAAKPSCLCPLYAVAHNTGSPTRNSWCRMCFSVGANATELSYNELKPPVLARYTKAEVCPWKQTLGPHLDISNLCLRPRGCYKQLCAGNTHRVLSIPGRNRLGQPCSHSSVLKEGKPRAQLQLPPALQCCTGWGEDERLAKVTLTMSLHCGNGPSQLVSCAKGRQADNAQWLLPAPAGQFRLCWHLWAMDFLSPVYINSFSHGFQKLVLTWTGYSRRGQQVATR